MFNHSSSNSLTRRTPLRDSNTVFSANSIVNKYAISCAIESFEKVSIPVSSVKLFAIVFAKRANRFSVEINFTVFSKDIGPPLEGRPNEYQRMPFLFAATRSRLSSALRMASHNAGFAFFIAYSERVSSFFFAERLLSALFAIPVKRETCIFFLIVQPRKKAARSTPGSKNTAKPVSLTHISASGELGPFLNCIRIS